MIPAEGDLSSVLENGMPFGGGGQLACLFRVTGMSDQSTWPTTCSS